MTNSSIHSFVRSVGWEERKITLAIVRSFVGSFVSFLKFVASKVLGFLDALDELILFDASLALDPSLAEDLLELFDPELGQVLLLHVFGFDGEFDGADLRVLLGDALAYLEAAHAQAERLRNIAFDGVNVIANLFLARVELVVLVGAVFAHGGFDLWLLARFFLSHGCSNIVHDLDAN